MAGKNEGWERRGRGLKMAKKRENKDERDKSTGDGMQNANREKMRNKNRKEI